MDKELKELMQIHVIGENEFLSQMVEDIVPVKEQRFTDLEIAANQKEEFRMVVYKKENPFVRFFKGLKFTFEKLRIIRSSKEFELQMSDIKK